MLRFIKALILLVVLLLGIVLALHNTQSVSVSYLLGQTDISLILLVWIALVIGVLVGLILGLSRNLGLRNQLRKTRKRLRRLENENKTLSNPALKDV